MLFVSYSSVDESAVRELVGDLERARLEVWLDEELRGGDVWWDEILQRIRECDVFLFALSANSRQSKPCLAELHYARDLGLPVLPVQIGDMDSVRVLPISDLQIVPYTERSIPNALGLVSAVQDKARSRHELPDPLPAAPGVPYAYLLRLSSAIEAPSLSIDEQADLVRQLRIGLEDEDDEGVRADIRSLLRSLRRRNDLTVRNAADIDAALAPVAVVSAPSTERGVSGDVTPAVEAPAPEHVPGPTSSPPLPVTPSPSGRTPAGWYPDPTGESSARYWDGAAWTGHVSGGTAASTPAPQPAPPVSPAAPGAPAPADRKGWSVTAIVLGVIGALLWFVGVVGIVVAIVAIAKQQRLSTGSLVVAILGTAIGFTWAAIYATTYT